MKNFKEFEAIAKCNSKRKWEKIINGKETVLFDGEEVAE